MVIGAILCGGASRRFGSDKAVAMAGDRPLGGVVRDALRSAGFDPVVAVGGSAGPTLGLVTVADRRPGAGPLAALASVLLWAGRGGVLVVPCDLPLITAEGLRPLIDAWSSTIPTVTKPTVTDANVADEVAVVARISGRPDQSVAIWPAAWGRRLWTRVEAGDRALRTALDAGPWLGVDLDPAALVDADTPGALTRHLGSAPPIA